MNTTLPEDRQRLCAAPTAAPLGTPLPSAGAATAAAARTVAEVDAFEVPTTSIPVQATPAPARLDALIRRASVLQPVKIADGLYLGGYRHAATRAGLAAAGVTHVINATFEHPNTFAESLTYLRIPAVDRHPERLMPYFPRVVAFAQAAHAAQGRLLIHCQEGISRSTTLTMALLMHGQRLRLAQAFAQVRACKADVEPAPQFLHELRLWEQQLFGDVTSVQTLTVLDAGWAPQSPSLQENVIESLTTLCSMAAVGICDEMQMAQARAKLAKHLRQIDATNLPKTLQAVAITAFALYPQARPRSAAARAELPQIYRMVAADRGWSDAHLQTTVENLFVGDIWEDELIDMPAAKKLASELVSGVGIGVRQADAG